MKRKIEKYDYENGVITVVEGRRYVNFYLTNSVKKRFSDLLEVNSYVEFKANYKTVKIINKKKCYQINHFLKISKQTPRTTKIIYDIKEIREKILKDITKDKYYLFLDLEMTMPPYYPVKNFEAEIIQVGYYITDNNYQIVAKNDYYLKPTKFKTVSKRTLKFLNLERGSVKDAKEYSYFYNDLKTQLKKYNPKVVVWGTNDYLAIKNSFKINKEKPIISQMRFINLLTKIKQYYNLFNDAGLFNVYEIFYHDVPNQEHHALNDAYVLLKIYQAFIKNPNYQRAFSKFE